MTTKHEPSRVSQMAEAYQDGMRYWFTQDWGAPVPKNVCPYPKATEQSDMWWRGYLCGKRWQHDEEFAIQWRRVEK